MKRVFWSNWSRSYYGTKTMTKDDDDDFHDEISTVKVDNSSQELLNDHRVVPRGKDVTSLIKTALAFTIMWHLQKHGRATAFGCKNGYVKICC